MYCAEKWMELEIILSERKQAWKMSVKQGLFGKGNQGEE
jgi:hypothetical protein